MRLAFVSDIHGNLHALKAVLEDAAIRGAEQIINLGDSLSGPVQPRETAEFLMQQDWIQLAGNHERQLLTLKPPAGSRTDRDTLAQLTPDILQWLASLPPTCQFNDQVFLCHGTPASDLQYYLETVEPGSTRLANAQEVKMRTGSVRAGLIACGHTHVPRAVRTADGTLIVNPGSVGLPGFDDDRPFVHKIENGSPDARYAIVEYRRQAWHAALLSVPYDHHAAADLALANGRPDWAFIVRSGYVGPGGTVDAISEPPARPHPADT